MTKIRSAWAAECAVRFMKCLREKIAALTDDEEVIRDTLDGETDVDAVMEALIELRNEAKTTAEARKALAATYNDAAGADTVRERKIKALMLDCLQAAGIGKWAGIAGSVSVRAGGVSTEITDAAMIPLQFMKPVPDVEKIKAALKAGEEVPGARLVQGEDTIGVYLPRGKAGVETEVGAAA